ncbi:MAG: hypothetical protein JF886_16135 [Candidatus Dormibacteraeota bacterium]|uniref:Uncharacterized protein n=1 Tax=Candidatus Aeolococcus gillhamiae TaxID=3127015 RepID=A0A934N7C7_9BACT|nr:hypothetical protein [Candidatus Dormibacteraeota bacterium]
MPNRFTAVPARPVPPAGRGMAAVLAVADLFMQSASPSGAGRASPGHSGHACSATSAV